MVMTLFSQVAVKPVGKPDGLPIAVAPVVVKVMSGVSKEFIQSEGLDEGLVTVLLVITVIVPEAVTVPQPPFNGML